MTRLAEIMDALGEAYPWELAVPGDNCGLLLGSPSTEVGRVLCSVDLTGSVVEHAAGSGCDLLVTHHPQFFVPPLAAVDESTPAGRVVARAVRSGLSVVCCHTNADCAPGGTADLMAAALDLQVVGPMIPSEGAFVSKVVVFTPPEAVETVFDAMADAGAGVIGDYTGCSFRSKGRGTFLPGEGSKPHSGEPGRPSAADEVRLETAAPSFRVPAVLSAIRGAHPYEEPAVDVYRTEAPAPWGLGRYGVLRGASTAGELAERLTSWSGSGRARLEGDAAAPVRRVAVAPGSANDLVGTAIGLGCDLLACGEVNWHMTLEAREAGMPLLTLGHLESERALAPEMARVIRGASERGGRHLQVDVYRSEEGV